MLQTTGIQVNLVVYQGISINRITMPRAKESPLGTFLRERRTHLDAVALGFDTQRRRTPGLRREEVAQRAHVSTTWYTWLEQGRGGAPSAEALDRIARALMLTEVEREHAHMLALGRPPGTSYQGADSVTPRVQRVLDSLPYSPAMVRTATWDVVAWNAAAAAVLTDYGTLELHKRNILKLLFCDPRAKQMQREWESVSHFVVAAFRADVVRAGASDEVKALVEELCRQSPEFDALWRNHDVRNYSDHVKRLRHPVLGEIALEHSQFAVDGRADLCLVVYNPVNEEDTRRIRAWVDSRKTTGSAPG
ncbi:helix-turn-helix transcriptional regulator [Dyella jiangningensis]|uniref:helix-turn-helix transcriptional regulator n=1 Tax=Dyella jiangningensis TaxID=1379159 RepID=UPI0030C8604D